MTQKDEVPMQRTETDMAFFCNIKPHAICRHHISGIEEVYQVPDMSYVNAGKPWRSSICPLRHPYKSTIIGASIHRGHRKDTHWHKKNFILLTLETGWFEFTRHLKRRDWRELRFCLGECCKVLWCLLWYQPWYSLWWHCERIFSMVKMKLIG